MKNFLFAFDFTERTMNDYIIDFLKKNKIDYFYQFPGVIVADLFGTDEILQTWDQRRNKRKKRSLLMYRQKI